MSERVKRPRGARSVRPGEERDDLGAGLLEAAAEATRRGPGEEAAGGGAGRRTGEAGIFRGSVRLGRPDPGPATQDRGDWRPRRVFGCGDGWAIRRLLMEP